MQILAFLYTYRYLGIFLATIFEGPVTMAAVGFLFKLGYFNFFLAYILMTLGDWVGDIGWYYIGYFGGSRFFKKFGRYFGIEEKNMEKVKELFRRHHNKILFFNKITMGFGLTIYILTFAGISKVPIKRFAMLNLLGGFIWTAFLMTLGYFFGHLYLLISQNSRTGFIVTVGILFCAALYGFSKFLRKEVLSGKIK
jgi:membrane protein DedA with SNARE-associated domain